MKKVIISSSSNKYSKIGLVLVVVVQWRLLQCQGCLLNENDFLEYMWFSDSGGIGAQI